MCWPIAIKLKLWVAREVKHNIILLNKIDKRTAFSYITSWNSWLDTKRESTWQVEFLIVTERRFLSSAPATEVHITSRPCFSFSETIMKKHVVVQAEQFV